MTGTISEIHQSMNFSFENIDAVYAYGKEHPKNFTPADAKKYSQKLVKSLWENTVLQRYTQHINAGGRNTRPEHAVGEKLYAAFLSAGASIEPEKIKIHFGSAGQIAPEQAGISLAMMILSSQVYLWSNETEDLADAAPLPKHTISRSVLPYPVMFWSRETEFTDGTGKGASNWMLVVHFGEGIRCALDRMAGDGTMQIIMGDLVYGQIWPDDFSDDPVALKSAGTILKRCGFLNSPYVSHTSHGLPRHLRRQMQQAGQKPIKEEVRVVKLRRETARQPAKGEPGNVDWNHQWWVSAHYRAQWYPSENAHRVIWISPYLKGPSDKPVLEKIYAVVR